MITRPRWRCLLLALLFLLAGCFDYHERITMALDGSARLEVTVSLDSLLFAMAGGEEGIERRAMEALGTLPEGVHLVSMAALPGSGEPGAERQFRVEVAADSVAAMERFAELQSEPGRLFDGQVVDLELEGLALRYRRTLGPGVLAAGGASMQGLGTAMAEGHTWTFELVTPGEILEHNGAAQPHEEGLASLRWQVEMDEQEGFVMEALVQPPAGARRLLWLLLLPPLLLVGWLRRWRARRRAAQSS